MLTKTQERILGSKGLSLIANKAVGSKRDILPSHDQYHFDELKKSGKADARADCDTYLHGMDEVVDSTEKVKSADESALKACLQKGGTT